MAGERRGDEPRDERRGERGALTVEYACLFVLAATLVALLVAVPFGPTIQAWLEDAICLATRGSCPRSGASEATTAAPARCRRAVDATADGFTATVVALDGGGSDGYELVERSDGTFAVTHDRSGRIGASLSAGHHARIDLGEVSVGGGLAANAATHLGVTSGTTWTFTDRAEARAWIDWHRSVGSAGERYDTPLMTRIGNPLAWGRTNSLGARLDRAAARTANDVLRHFGAGLEPPVAPTRSHEFVEGEWGVEILGRVGIPGAEIAARLGGATQLGQRVDLATGDTTLYWELDTELAARISGLDGAGHTAGVELGGRVGITLDAQGDPSAVEVVTSVPGEPGLDPTALGDPRAVLTAPADPLTEDPSLYEVTLHLPVEDADLRGVLDGLGKTHDAGASASRAGALADRLWDEGAVGLVEHDVRSQRYGFDAITAFGPGAALGAGRSHTDRTAVAAHYLDHPDGGGTRDWQRWTACVGG